MARIQQVSLNFSAANLATPWILHDYYEAPFSVALAVTFDYVVVGTFSVQYTCDNNSQDWQRQVSASQSTTTITVSDSGPPGSNGTHGLNVGDVVRIPNGPFGAGGLGDGYDYPVASVTSGTVYTLTSTISQTVPLTAVYITSSRIFTHATLTGIAATTGGGGRATGNYAYPVQASRLIMTAHTTTGYAYLTAAQGSAGS